MPNLDESTGVITTTEVPKKPLINYEYHNESDIDAILTSAGLAPVEISREFLLQFNTLAAA